MQFDPKTPYVITVKGDVNDADYIVERHTLPGNVMTEYVALLKRVCKGGQANKWLPNWEVGDHRQGQHPKDMHGLSDKEFYMLEDLMPTHDGHPIHTLESVTIEPVVEPLWVWTGKETD
jgi:hypothetical protein